VSSSEYPLAPDPALEWTGAKRHYDLVKEFVVALIAVAILAVVLAAVFSSPDEKPVTIAGWANAAPSDFLATALSELDGTSGTAGYGPPYTSGAGASQNVIGGLSLQRLVGARIPVNPAKVFIFDPLSVPAQSDPRLAAALRAYVAAPGAQQQRWTDAYTKALPRIRFKAGAPCCRAAATAPWRRSCPASSTRPAAAGSTARSSPPAASTRAITPSRCCSSPTAAISPAWPPSRTCSASSGE
jgi:hypothetical protein